MITTFYGPAHNSLRLYYGALELLARFWAMCTAHGVIALGAHIIDHPAHHPRSGVNVANRTGCLRIYSPQ